MSAAAFARKMLRNAQPVPLRARALAAYVCKRTGRGTVQTSQVWLNIFLHIDEELIQ